MNAEDKNALIMASLDDVDNIHDRGKYHFIAGLQFNWIWLDQTIKIVVICLVYSPYIQTSKNERSLDDGVPILDSYLSLSNELVTLTVFHDL